MLNILILFFGAASYLVGTKQIFTGKYRPSFFSRTVWLLLAIISFGGVLASGSSKASITLAAIFLLGNAVICIGSFLKGTREIGKLEYICLAILAISLLVWVIFNSPLVSLAISLFAHLVGAAPTYKRVIQNPQNESFGFWSLFFVASFLSIVASLGNPAQAMIFPIYFTIFDGSMALLSIRNN